MTCPPPPHVPAGTNDEEGGGLDLVSVFSVDVEPPFSEAVPADHQGSSVSIQAEEASRVSCVSPFFSQLLMSASLILQPDSITVIDRPPPPPPAQSFSMV